jgi:cell division protein ZapA (FtsZ GTPase activity inhibitor)
MGNNDFEARVRGRVMKFPAVDGLSELETGSIVAQVEEKISEIEKKLNIPDTSKLAILAAFDFAVKLHLLRQRSETNLTADSKKLDEMVEKLEKALSAGAPEEK